MNNKDNRENQDGILNSLDISSLMEGFDLNSIMKGNDLGSLINNKDQDSSMNNSLDINSLMKNVDMGALMKNVDINSLLNMTTNLLKDDSLKNYTKDLGNNNQTPILNLLNSSDKKENTALASLSEQLEKVFKELSEIKNQLEHLNIQIKHVETFFSKNQESLLYLIEENKQLTSLVNKLSESNSSKKKKK